MKNFQTSSQNKEVNKKLITTLFISLILFGLVLTMLFSGLKLSYFNNNAKLNNRVQTVKADDEVTWNLKIYSCQGLDEFGVDYGGGCWWTGNPLEISGSYYVDGNDDITGDTKIICQATPATGYTFRGWYSKKAGFGTLYSSAQNFTFYVGESRIDGDIYPYATLNSIPHPSNSVEFPANWQNEVCSDNQDAININAKSINSIDFRTSAPSGYQEAGVLNCGIMVYVNSSMDLVFVYNGTMTVPNDCSFMIGGGTADTMLNNAKKIAFTNLNTSNATIMRGMFCGVESATYLNLSNLNTSNVTNMNAMFDSMREITSIDVSNFNTTKLTTMSGMFELCDKLNSITFGNFNTSNVTDMRHLFYEDKALTSLDLSSFDMSKTTQATKMFDGCTSLQTIKTPKNVKVSVDLPTGKTWFDASNNYAIVTTLPMNDSSSHTLTTAGVFRVTFDACGGYTSTSSINVTYGSTYGTLPIPTRSGYTFNGWYTGENGSGTRIYASTTVNKTSNHTLYAKWFDNSFHLPQDLLVETCKAMNSANYSLILKNMKSTLKEVLFTTSVPSGYSSDSSFHISEESGYQDQYLDFYISGTYPSNITGIAFVLNNGQLYAPEYSSDMFSDFTALTTIDFSNFSTEYVHSMSAMFAGCTSLTSLDLSGFDTSNVENMEFMFKGCSKLTSLNVDNFDTMNVTTMEGMFASCSELTSLDISNFDLNNVATISGMFNTCKKLITITLGDLYTANVEYMDFLFYGCSSLTSIKMSGFNLGNVTTMSSMFSGCSSLKTLNLSEVNTDKVVNTSNMFYNCSSLTYLDLSSFDMTNVTSATDMFTGCSALDIIYTPVNVKSNLSVTLPKTMYCYNDYSIWSNLPTSESASRTLLSTAPTFTITVNNNNGSGGFASSSNYALSDSEQNITLTNPTLTGYAFNGWTVSWENSTHSTDLPSVSGRTLTIPAKCYGNITLTANYSANKYTNTLNYDANGGKGEPTAQTLEVTYPNTQSTFTISSTVPTLDGYTFAGWFTQANGGTQIGTSYVVGSNNVAGNQSATIYAHWNILTYSITYNLDGGSVASSNPISYTAETEDFTLNNPTKVGYTFAGWTGSNGTTPQTTVIIAKGSVGNRTYTANWTANTDTAYKVQHWQENLNVDGSVHNSSNYTLKETENLKGTTDASVTPSVKSYTGFTSPSTQTVTISADGSTVVNYYYTRNSYALTLTVGTGTNLSASPNGSVEYGDIVTITASLKAGYQNLVTSSYKTGDTNTTVTIESNKFTMPAYEITIVTSSNVITYTITYNLDGGTVETENPTNYTVETEDFTLNNPTKVGYTFIGWTGTGLNSATTTVTVAKGSTGDRTYTANWNTNQVNISANPTSFNLEYGYISGNISTITASSGSGSYKYEITSSVGTWSLSATSGNTITLTFKTGQNVASNYTATVKVTDTVNGTTAEVTVTAVVTKVNTSIVIKPTAKLLTYNGSAQALINAGSASGGTIQYKVGTGSYSTSIPTGIDAGTYTVYYKVVGDANHNDVAEASLNVVINKKSLTLTWDNLSFEYNGSEHIPTATVSGAVSGEIINLTIVESKTDVGTYTATASISSVTGGQAKADNYSISNSTQNWEIKAKELVISADNKIITYGDDLLNYTYIVTGLASGDNESVLTTKPTISCSYSRYGDIGTYDITISGAVATNYVITYQKGILTVNRKQVTATWSEPTTFIYDGLEHSVTATIGGLVNNDAVSFTYGGTISSVNAGNFTAVISGLNGTKANNYSLPSNVNQTWEITKETLKAPTNLMVSVDGIVTWDDVIGATGYQISIDNSNWLVATSGIDYNATITASTGDRTVYVRAISNNSNYTSQSPSVNKTVKVYQLTINKDIGINDVTGEGKYISGKTVTISATVSSGYTFDKWLVTSGNTPENVLSTSTKVTINSETILRVTTTVNQYTITYDLDGGTVDIENPTTYTVETETFTLNNSTKTGYTFVGFTGSNGEEPQVVVTIEKGSTGDKQFKANWTPNADTKYLVEHYLQDLNGTSYTKADTDDLTGVTLEKTNAVAKDYTGFTVDNFEQLTINADGSTVVRINYTRNTHTLTLVKGRGIDEFTSNLTSENGLVNNNGQVYVIRFGASVEFNALLKAGYENITYNNGTIDIESPIVMNDNNIVITASADIITYTISYNLDGGSVENAPESYNVETETFNIPVPTKTGFNFTGYTGSNGENPQTVVTIEKGSIGNKEFTANWTANQVKPTAIIGLIYSGLEQEGVLDFTGEGFTQISGQVAGINAGDYSATFKLKDGYVWEDGTTLDVVINFNIAKKDLLITAENKSMTYGENAPTYSFITSGFVNNETEKDLTNNVIYDVRNSNDESVVISSSSDAGVYIINISGFTSNNYNITYIKGNLTINKANGFVSVEKDEIKLKYPETTENLITSNHGGKLSITNSNTEAVDVNLNDTTIGIVTKTKGGLSTITVNCDETNNYTKASVTFVIAVENGDILYTVNGYSGQYDGEAHSIVVNVSSPNDVTITYSEDEINYQSSIFEYINVSTNTVYFKIEKEGYNTILGSAVVEITRKTIASVQTIDNLIYSGLSQTGVTGQFVELSGEYASINAGNYIAYAIPTSNYAWEDGSFSQKEIEWTISKKDLTITAENKNMTYGENAPTYSFALSGFVNNETVNDLTGNIIYTIKNSSNETVEITTSSNVGVYTIIPSGFSSNNYEITYENGILTISRASAEITLSKQAESVTYGEMTTFTISYNGDGNVNVASENNSVVEVIKQDNVVTLKVIAYSETPIEIVITSTAGQNYGEAESKVFTLTTLKRLLEVTSLSDTKVYDGTELTKHQASITNGDLANFDEVADLIAFDFIGAITDFGEIDNEFTAKITRNDVDITNYYTITYIYGTLSVTKAQLNAPTNLLVNSYGIVTFDSVLGATGYEISVNNSLFTTCVSGNDYNNLITAVAGEREVKVRAVSSNENYISTSDVISVKVMVYTLTLNKEDRQGITKISSKNYISGRSVDLTIELEKDDEFVKWIADENSDKPLDEKSKDTSVIITKDSVITAKIQKNYMETPIIYIILGSMAVIVLLGSVITLLVVNNKNKSKKAKKNRIRLNTK